VSYGRCTCIGITALARAKQLGFAKITLETASVLKEAIRLYTSYGFKPCQPDHLSCRCDQAYMLDLTKP
jgi:putative acetyltransferase